MRYRTIIAIVAATAVCSTASDAKFHLLGTHKSKAVLRSGPQPVPYHWTQGAAPKAHWDMVAQFGRVGLRPGQYLWATTTPTDGDTRIVVDLLTQMAYVYRGSALVGASTMSSAKTGHITPYGYWTILE